MNDYASDVCVVASSTLFTLLFRLKTGFDIVVFEVPIMKRPEQALSGGLYGHSRGAATIFILIIGVVDQNILSNIL